MLQVPVEAVFEELSLTVGPLILRLSALNLYVLDFGQFIELVAAVVAPRVPLPRLQAEPAEMMSTETSHVIAGHLVVNVDQALALWAFLATSRKHLLLRISACLCKPLSGLLACGRGVRFGAALPAPKAATPDAKDRLGGVIVVVFNEGLTPIGVAFPHVLTRLHILPRHPQAILAHLVGI